MKVLNKAKSTRIFPDGTQVEPGHEAEFDEKDWAAMKKHPVVAGWLKADEVDEVKAEKKAEEKK